MGRKVTDDLPDWSDYADDDWPTLLIGNGLSINLWSGFRYDSLYDEALDQGTLAAAVQDIFTELNTTNFETALECLHHARIVLKALGRRTKQVDDAYDEVRDALLTAVNTAHVDWRQFPDPTHTAITQGIAGHTDVYTTNYDLCVYWSLLGPTRPFSKDFFWGPDNSFDPADVHVGDDAILIYYLHGAMHLWQDDSTGIDGKWTRAQAGTLLDVLEQYTPTSDRRPLFVSEGTSKSKVRTIQRSTYLSFCLDRLRDDDRPTVIFGHSLSEPDAHIIEALNAGRRKKVAVSLRPSSDSKALIAAKSRIIEALGRHKVDFFDSTTHPLGDPALNIG